MARMETDYNMDTLKNVALIVSNVAQVQMYLPRFERFLHRGICQDKWDPTGKEKQRILSGPRG